jgi:hypothetical protein
MYKEIQHNFIETISQSEGPKEANVDQSNPSEAQVALSIPPYSECATSTLTGTTSSRMPVEVGNRRSYSSILKSSPPATRSTSPSSALRSPSPSPSTSSARSVQSPGVKRMLAMEDLQLRFKNKPAPSHASAITQDMDASSGVLHYEQHVFHLQG